MASKATATSKMKTKFVKLIINEDGLKESAKHIRVYLSKGENHFASRYRESLGILGRD